MRLRVRLDDGVEQAVAISEVIVEGGRVALSGALFCQIAVFRPSGTFYKRFR